MADAAVIGASEPSGETTVISSPAAASDVQTAMLSSSWSLSAIFRVMGKSVCWVEDAENSRKRSFPLLRLIRSR